MPSHFTREQILAEINSRQPSREQILAELGRRQDVSAPEAAAPASFGASPRAERAAKSRGEAEEKRAETLRGLPPHLAALAESVSPMKAAAIGAGRGLYTLGRGVGLVEPASQAEQEGYAALEAVHPAATTTGEIVAEAAPFLIPAGAAAQIASAPWRIGATTLTGAIEGGIIARGEGRGEEGIVTAAGLGGLVAGGAEALLPVLGRAARKVYGKAFKRGPSAPLLTEQGLPTPELQEALDITGTSFDDITDEAISKLKKRAGAEPEQAARAARFESQRIPVSRGDITQQFQDVATEQRLLGSATSEAADEVRDLAIRRSQAFEARVNELVDDLGVPADAGDAMKDALAGRKTLMEKERREMYQEFADRAARSGAGDLPIATDAIADAIPADRELRRIERAAGNDIAALDGLLVEFGIDKTPQKVEKLVASGVDPIPLTVSNFDEFSQALNQIGDNAATASSGAKQTYGVAQQIKRAVNGEADLVAEAVNKAGITDADLLEPLKAGKRLTGELKTEFSPQSIVGKLTGKRPDNATPIIEASKAADTVLRHGAPVEHLERTIDSLNKAGAKGKRAIGDMRAVVVMKALDDALKAPSRKAAGVELVGSGQFYKSLDKFGDEKLSILFKDAPDQLKKLKALKQTAFDISPTEKAIPKGSAYVNMDILSSLQSIPGLRFAAGTMKSMSNAANSGLDVMKVMKAQPERAKMASLIREDFPSLAAALGVVAVTQNGEQ